MHRALEIQDVVYAILEQARISGDRNTLACVALVSKYFSEAACRLIWQTVSDLESLINLLRESPDLVIRPRPSYRVTLSRPLEESDMHTFMKRAKYVRNLTYNDEFVTSDALKTINDCIPLSKIFERLSTFEWRGNSIGQIQGVEMFATPALRNLRVSVPQNRCAILEDQITPVLDGIATSAPNLENLILLLPTVAVVVERHITSLLSKTGNLRQLRLLMTGRLPNEAIVQLSAVPYLRRVNLSFSSPNFERMTEQEQGSGFRLLVEIELSLKVLDQCKDILERVFGPLRRVQFTCTTNEYDSPEEIRRFFLIVSRLASIRVFHLEYPNLPAINDPPQDETLYHITHYTLSPLGSLINLESIKLWFKYMPDLDDSDLEQLGIWWPKLKHLSFTRRPFKPSVVSYSQVRATPTGLVALLDACRELRYLFIYVPLPKHSMVYNRLQWLTQYDLAAQT